MPDLSNLYNLIHSYDDAISAAKPGSDEAGLLIKKQRSLIDQLPGITPPGETTAAHQDLASMASDRNDGYRQAHQDAIAPPQLLESARAGKVKDNDMEKMQALIKTGISPLTNPGKFLEAFGATANQNGIARSWGPLQGIRNIISPDFQRLQMRQRGLMQVGAYLTQEMLKQQAERMNAPQTLGEANSLLPGLVQPTENQRMGAPLGANDQGPIAPYDPNAQLSPVQQDLALQGIRGLAGGHLMNAGNEIVPTGYASMQGKMINPAVAHWQLGIAQGGPIIAPPVPVPASLANNAADLIAQRNRQDTKPPDFDNKLEANSAIYSRNTHGKVMPFGTLAQVDPAGAEKVRQQTMSEAKDMYNFQQGQQLQRQISAAYPVAMAHNEAELDKPVQDPQLLRDPETGKAAPTGTTFRQATKQGLVKLRPDQLEVMNQSEVIDKGLQEIKKIVEKKFRPPAGTPIGEFLGAMIQTGKLAALRASGDPDIMKMDSIITRLTAPLVKSQGDTANIAVAEREMFAHSLVNNQASAPAILSNLDNVIAATRSVRQKMGFTDPDSMKQALVASGNSPEKADKIVQQRFPKEVQSDAATRLRARFQELRAKGLSIDQIKADKEIQRLDSLASKKK